MFFLGFITGLLISVLIFSILAFFRAGIEQRIKIVEKNLETAGPKAKGEIILPEDEKDIARKKIIAKNKREGRDTPLADLY